jgi:hypothetical protein
MISRWWMDGIWSIRMFFSVPIRRGCPIDRLIMNRNTHDAFHILNQEELVSSATVYPSSTEEVSMVVKWANQYLIPIYPNRSVCLVYSWPIPEF